MRGGEKTSWVWNLFKEISCEKSECNICGKAIGRVGRSTTAMITHLNNVHNVYEPGLDTSKSVTKENSHDTDEEMCGISEGTGNQLSNISSVAQESWVWNYFTPSIDERSICIICNSSITIEFGSTNMVRHLKSHQIEKGTNVNRYTQKSPNEKAAEITENEEKSWVLNYFKVLLNDEFQCNICNDTVESISKTEAHLSTHGFAENGDDLDSTERKQSLKSWVWIYFKRVSDDKSLCTVCNKTISRSKRSTSGMRRHLGTHNILENGNDISGILPEEAYKNARDMSSESRSDSESKADVEIILSDSDQCNEPEKPMKLSWIWEHFEKLSKDRSKCKFCYKVITCTEGSTSGLEVHLRDYHNIQEPYSGIHVDAKLVRCYVCDNSDGLDRYELGSLGSHTETPIYEIIGFFTGTKLTLHERKEFAVCHNCFVSLEKYDELLMQARTIQENLMNLFRKKNQPACLPESIFIKQEPVSDYEEELQFLSENLVNTSNIHDENSSKVVESNDVNTSENNMEIEVDRTEQSKPKQEISCKHCKIMFTSRKEFLQHMKTHAEGKFSCGQCSQTFRKKTLLEIHLAADHGPPPGAFKCTVCSKTCKTQKSIRDHYKIHKREGNLRVGFGAGFKRKRKSSI